MQTIEKFESNIIELKDDVYVLPPNFNQDFGDKDIIISGIPGKTIITSNAPIPGLVDTTGPDTYKDGDYVAAVVPYYSTGGAYAHIKYPYDPNILYTQGTPLTKQNGKWSLRVPARGFQTKGNIKITGVSFKSTHFYPISPFGLKETDGLYIDKCEFINVPRVLSSELYGGADKQFFPNNALIVYPNDGRFRFKFIQITNNVFDNIHQAIIWGCPPHRTLNVSNNVFRNNHTSLTHMNLYMKNYAQEDFFSNKVQQIISNNLFMDSVMKNMNTTTTIIRTSGIANINNNTFMNCTQQFILLYGGDSVVTENYFNNTIGNKDNLTPIILIKNIDAPHHRIYNNTFDAVNNIAVASESEASVTFNQNRGKSLFLYNRNTNIPADKVITIIEDNLMICPNPLNINAKDPTHYNTLTLRNNKLMGVITPMTSKNIIFDNFIQE